MIKLKIIKILTKKNKEKKEIKSKKTKLKALHIQIIIEGLNWKQIKR